MQEKERSRIPGFQICSPSLSQFVGHGSKGGVKSPHSKAASPRKQSAICNSLAHALRHNLS